MAPLAEPALAAVRDGRTRIVPERWEAVYVHWLENIRDWNISRQLWWGHRIPCGYCDACGPRPDREPRRTSARLPAAAAARCGRTRTCSTPGSRRGLAGVDARLAGRRAADLRAFYPSDVLVTAPGYPVLLGGAHDDGGLALPGR
jgi:valyl-tRNA synthetase